MSNGAKMDRRRLDAAERTRVAASMRVEGRSYEEIAKELGWSHRSSAKKAIDRHIRELPREDVEILRATLLERLDEVQKALRPLLSHKDMATRLRAAEVIGRTTRRVAEISGVLDTRPIIALPPPPEAPVDLSRLSIAEVRVLQYLTRAARSDRGPTSELLPLLRAWEAEVRPGASAVLANRHGREDT